MKPFINEVYLDFSQAPIAKKQRAAIDLVRSSFGKEYANIIAGKNVRTDAKTISYNPANPKEVVGVFQKAGRDQAEKAMKAAVKAFQTWKTVSPKERAGYLFKAAAVIRKRRLEINAWMISEVGKNYLEADADTCEAIDFLEFYGREMLRYGATGRRERTLLYSAWCWRYNSAVEFPVCHTGWDDVCSNCYRQHRCCKTVK